eukprot:scaffold12992_cov130-Amphora_coffeaeformis.AAC.1
MAYSTVRHLRSAAGWYETVGRLTAEGGSWAYEEKGDRLRKGVFLSTQVLPLTRFTKGMKER